MKTGFTNANVKIPGKKYYMYHGILTECLKDPDPYPVKDYPIGFGPQWVLLASGNMHIHGGYFTYNQVYTNFLPSAQSDTCSLKWPDGKRRFYKVEVFVIRYTGFAISTIAWSNGYACKLSYVRTEGYSVTLNTIDIYYAQGPLIFYAFNTELGSYYKVWKSSTGELPY